jgi:hypothetical protein
LKSAKAAGPTLRKSESNFMVPLPFAAQKLVYKSIRCLQEANIFKFSTTLNINCKIQLNPMVAQQGIDLIRKNFNQF